MKTTLTLDADLLKMAQDLTGLDDADAVIHAALKSLIARESGKQLEASGETQPRLKPDRPRRSRERR